MLSWSWCPTCLICCEVAPSMMARNILEIPNVCKCMSTFRWMLAGLLTAGLLAQGQQDGSKPPAASELPLFRVPVEVVVAPVIVMDRNGDYVDGLQPNQFHLFDNTKEQEIKVDVAFQPISMVIAVQANDRVESVLPQIQRIGSLIEP